MYLQDVSNVPFTTTLIKIKYDCCNKEHTLKWKDAKKNYEANVGKHICRTCKLKSNNPAKREDVKAKAKKTIEEKYGGVLPINTPDQIAKKREKLKDPNFVEKVLEKRKETCLEKYGVEHHMKCDAGKEAVKASMQEKYGVDYPLQAEEVKQKMRETCRERYGVDNVMDVPEVKAKVAQTMMDRYGVERYNQLPEMKQYLRENCVVWLEESYKNPWNLGVPLTEETRQKISETVIEKILQGDWHGGSSHSLKGRYISKKCFKKQTLFRSSFELKFHLHLDMDDDVLFYDYEPFQIPYYDTENKLRHYIVDFIVKYKNGDFICVEIKNNYNKQEFLESDKYKQIQNLCKENKLNFKVLANKEIDELKINLNDIIKDKEIVELFD